MEYLPLLQATTSSIPWREILIGFVSCAAVSLVGAIALLFIAARQIAEIDVPDNADFFETLQHLPITVPLALDLLDFAFDVFAAPIAWVILELLGLQALQMVTVFEGLVPGTQLLPTLTIAWFIARMMERKQPRSEVRESLRDYQFRQRSRRRRPSLADDYRHQALPMPGDDHGSAVDGEYYEEDMDYLPIEDEEEPW